MPIALQRAIAKKNGISLANVATLPIGTRVWYHYRSAIGHGTIVGIASEGTSHATTRYRIRQTDHHPGEPAIVIHTGAALHKAA